LRFKKLYYKTLLEQEVAWYDSNDVNKLATEVATNISHIEGAIGQKCFMLLSTMTTSLFGFFYAFFKCWELSLVLTGVLPFMMVAGVLMMKSMTNMAVVSKTSYEEAAGRAEQVFFYFILRHSAELRQSRVWLVRHLRN
jgi:ATP-binding cassette subfamily B (MDR/TAP) protein 1